LYTDGEFLKKLDATFEGDYRLTFNMAPPIFHQGLDELGRPRKRSFGPWMMPALKLLARFKWLRGSWLDPFGWLEGRREERALLEDYRRLVQERLASLSVENHAAAVELASLPDQIRGYGPVKSAAIADYYRQRSRGQ
jgi:indolepyruvate ferredoxin oxidoreductase